MTNAIELKFGNLSTKSASVLIDTYQKLSSEDMNLTVTAPVAGPAKPAKPAAAKPAPATEVEVEPANEFDLGEETAPGEEVPVLTLEVVVAEFQKYAKANTREKAGKVLASFGVKSVRDLDPKKYPDVMKKLAK